MLTTGQIAVIVISTTVIAYLIIDFIKWIKNAEEIEKEKWRSK